MRVLLDESLPQQLARELRGHELEYQQNVARFGIGIVVLVARTNRLVHLLPLVPLILRALETLRPGELVRVER